MSINNIDFSARQLAGLYTKNLVILEKGDGVLKKRDQIIEPNLSPAGTISGPLNKTAKAEPGRSSLTTIPHLGGFNKKVLIIAEYQQESIIPADALQFLTSILTACKLGLEDVAIYNLHQQPDLQYDQIMETLQPKVVLLLGVDFLAIDAPFKIPEFQVMKYNHAQFVTAPTLEAMNKPTDDAKVLKSKLWANLKNIFLT